MLKKLFGFDAAKHSVKTEVLAGITTFLTMAYILAVNPSIMGVTGMDKGALFTSTALVSALACILMAVYAKLPIALAPGMGLNAFFAFVVCLAMGYSWQMALTAVFLEGLIFIFLTITNLREKLLEALPLCVKNAIGPAIGLFIAFLGMQNAGLIVKNDATMVALGDMTAATPLLCLIGLCITVALMIKGMNGALLWGMLITTLLGIPMGVTNIGGIVSAPPSMESICFALQFDQIFTVDMAIIVFTLLFMDMFDTIGTLFGVAQNAKMVDANGNVPWIRKAMMVDACATTAGALLGNCTVTAYMESASGVTAGGRTGLTAMTTGVCFLVALFMAPLFLSIPTAATGLALILVGVMMMTSVTQLDFLDYTNAVPSFMCIAFMVLSCSISNGIVMGLLSYVLIHIACGRFSKLTIGNFILAAIFSLKFVI